MEAADHAEGQQPPAVVRSPIGARSGASYSRAACTGTAFACAAGIGPLRVSGCWVNDSSATAAHSVSSSAGMASSIAAACRFE